MSKIAFVTGLPRTRTAWFAALINAHNQNYDPVSGYHELLTKCETLEEYREWLTSDGELSVDCSSRIDYIEGSKLLVILRPITEIELSLRKLPLFEGVDPSELADHLVTQQHKLQVQWQRAQESHNLLFVKYSLLDDTSTICECLEFLGIEPDQVVIEYMQEFNIQAQYLNSITPEEFNLMGSRINSMFELRKARQLMQAENDNERTH